VILDTSSQPLSLRRVPPNILVGLGAKEFAEEHGMVAILNDSLVSKNAKDRYVRWNKDLKKAEDRLHSSTHAENEPGSPFPDDYETAVDPASHAHRRDHTNAILTGTWNEGQPDSPSPTSPPTAETASPVIPSTPATSRPSSAQRSANNGGKLERSHMGFIAAPLQSRSGGGPTKRPKIQESFSYDSAYGVSSKTAQSPSASLHDGSAGTDDEVTVERGTGKVYNLDPALNSSKIIAAGAKRPAEDDDMDLVTDTIGAIAIDMQGNIAAGSSSGGIGMKHRGRIGPAALVGIGTAVIPQDPDDEDQVSVATVTSGTGEHMATSLASAKCAERLFTGTRRGRGGRSEEEPDEHSLMEAFILKDFMGHPGIKDQPSVGAIGVMAVKKDRTGIYFYFAHNTDSFALASMSSSERDPLCVMSRLGKVRPVAQGGRKVRID